MMTRMGDVAIFDGDRDKLGEYVRHMADLMGLKDWIIRVVSDPLEDKTAAGHCDVPYGRRIGNISFAADWAEYEPEEMRRVVCHELGHCHAAAMTWSCNNVQRVVPDTMFQVFDGAFTDSLEIMVDAIAIAWARTLPLPIAEPVEVGTEIEEAA